MSDYIVTVDVPIFVRVENVEEDGAADIAEDYWREQKIHERLTAAIDDSSWFVGDPYEDWDVSEDLSEVADA